MSERKRYLVTFRDESVDAASAARILGGQAGSEEGIAMSLAAESSRLVKHFADTGTSVAMLTPNEADTLRGDDRIIEVIEDFEVQAH
ncbi:MAG: hypothetical protein H7039_12965 [Bryobacteraceae bacterium]|nr:hypothetical protein [Bryobacteraceae bacterium]